MIWEQYRTVMERRAIKTDDMATEDAYFMATHMPFAQLEIYQGGRTTSPATLMDEEEVFEQLIYNPDNEHRMIIVRGDNGTGKSHLIRFLKAKFENSPSTIYNPASEQLVFLRRLNNSIRGAFSQLVDQKVIKDPQIEEKLRKFIDSSDSKDESAFKTDILYSYIAAVRNDLSGKTYKPVICRDIASFLSDSRVSEHLLREGGAISRCYNIITAPSNQVLKTTSIFDEEDVNVSKILRAVIKQGDPQASDFASTLKGDEDEIIKLVNYLNRFTREVVQRCADISSESTKTVFEQLRKDLKKQGKNLTLFIEDFTGFTGIDSELITVLSTEHGGDYEDLCRVTAIIGITNDYYDQFRDNFTDRVTHQISVTDRSYGTDDFIIQMAGRYLNAIYCSVDELRRWNSSGAKLENLPISTFTPPCKWESITVAEKEMTLYPFNKRALLSLYESLPIKSPRTFLKDVLRSQLKEYFDGKQYGTEWRFPMNPANIQMEKDPHSSAIDRLDSITPIDKNRLKTVFAIWGDGSAAGIREADGSLLFGTVNKKFLDDICLSQFSGIGEIVDKSSGESIEINQNDADTDTVNPGDNSISHSEKDNKPQPVSGATKNYYKYKNDITAWFTKNENLKYDPDYRDWLRTLICGSARQSGAINWQDIGVPAYVAKERLADLGSYYIEDQSSPINADRALVCLKRTVEGRDALLAINEMIYADGWDFEEAPYYQQRLITWLERNRRTIIENVTSTKPNEKQLPVLKWCLALQYLRAKILGKIISTDSPIALLSSLFEEVQQDDSIIRDTQEWKDLIRYVHNKEADFDSALTTLRRAAATTMGAIHFSVDSSTKSCFRTDELIVAIEELNGCNWDIEEELPTDIPSKHMLYNPAALLKSLYPKIQAAMDAESKYALSLMDDLSNFVGEINQSSLIDALSSIQDLFATFAANSIIGNNELRTKYEKPPIDTAKTIISLVQDLDQAKSECPIKKLSAYSKNSSHAINVFLNDFRTIASKAKAEEEKAKKETKNAGGPSDFEEISNSVLVSLRDLCEELEGMEVKTDVAN